MLSTINDHEDFLRKERQDARRAARKFANAVASGDVDSFEEALYDLSNAPDGWPPALRMVAKLSHVSDGIRELFLAKWIESQQLPLSIGNRKALAKGLRVLMPGRYEGAALKLYRGTTFVERHRRHYGFSWSTRLDIAQRFAANHTATAVGSLVLGNSGFSPIKGWDRGIVLETIAPARAILLVRKEENHYDEAEVVVDPFELVRVRIYPG